MEKMALKKMILDIDCMSDAVDWHYSVEPMLCSREYKIHNTWARRITILRPLINLNFANKTPL